MTKNWAVKITAVLLLIVLLLIAVGMIQATIREREKNQENVIREVSSSTSTAQQLVGPILVLPYKIERTYRSTDRNIDQPTVVVESRTLFLLPQELKIEGKADVAARKLGIYQAQVYSSQLNWSGALGKVDLEALEQQQGFVEFEEPYIVVSLTDTRGIMNVSAFTLNGKTHEFKEGVVHNQLGMGVHVPLNIEHLRASASNPFSFNLQVQGTGSLGVVPVGRKTDFMLTSGWPHPNFMGATLPQTREVTDQGFSAHWQNTWFANNLNDLFGDNKVPNLKTTHLPAFKVSMVETVNQYQLNERSVKYAILFIGLTFIAFLAFELLAQLKIHPVQYSLVGFSLVLFYLLLLALSEHIGFNLAYAIASIGSSGLIGLYLCSVLKGVVRGVSFTAGLAALYGLLFLILQSEDMALLLGSALLFIILGAIMLATRKIDWYALTDNIEIGKPKARVTRTVTEEGSIVD